MSLTIVLQELNLSTNMWPPTNFQVARLSDKLQVIITVSGLVFIDNFLNVVGDLRNGQGSRWAEDLIQLCVKFMLQPGVPSGDRSGRKQQDQWTYLTNVSESFKICVVKCPLVLTEALLQSFDPRLALLHCPHVAPLCHLLCNLGEYVAVFQAALQSSLHGVLPPDVEKMERLLIRPGNFCVRYNWKRALLRVWNGTRRLS